MSARSKFELSTILNPMNLNRQLILQKKNEDIIHGNFSITSKNLLALINATAFLLSEEFLDNFSDNFRFVKSRKVSEFTDLHRFLSILLSNHSLALSHQA